MKNKIPKSKRYLKTQPKLIIGIDLFENKDVGVQVTFLYGKTGTNTWSRTALGRLFMEGER